MVWSDWWKHDPVPETNVTDPYMVKVKQQQVNDVGGAISYCKGVLVVFVWA